MIYKSPVDTRHRVRAAITEDRRQIYSLLRDGASMISDGEVATYQPDSLNERDMDWIRRGNAEACLSSIAVRLNVAQDVKVVQSHPDDQLPTFVIYR